MPDIVLPIAEVFHSFQGEGRWVGTPMLFIRTAGCNVGKAPEYGECQTVDGRVFTCDTDYRKSYNSTLRELVEKTWEEHICITGGEPFLHDLSDLDFLSRRFGKFFHIETSGTIEIPMEIGEDCWISCSPKNGFLPTNRWAIDEWKFLVDEAFSERVALEVIGDSQELVYVQPINDINAVDSKHLYLCQELTKRHPGWSLSVQMHKLIGLR